MDAAATFAIASDGYAAGRPYYPPALFEWIARQCARHEAAWDCATGTGQAAIGLSPWFTHVEATDISAEQVGHGAPAPNVRYSVQPAEATQFPDASFDLVTVAQALHWFDYPRFWREMRRVARPGAFFCAFGYSWWNRTAELEALHGDYLDPLLELLEPHWADNNRVLWRGYRSGEIAFPFERVEAPPFNIELDWTVERIVAFTQTWSAWKRAMEDPDKAASIRRLEATAAERFAGRGAMRITFPIPIAAGRTA
jgi:SAM-dependent methyltransferase